VKQVSISIVLTSEDDEDFGVDANVDIDFEFDATKDQLDVLRRRIAGLVRDFVLGEVHHPNVELPPLPPIGDVLLAT
jgi:hypothetical protein